MIHKVVNESGQNGRRAVKVRGLTEIGGWFYYRPGQKDGVRPPRMALGTRVFDEAVKLAIEMSQNRESRFVPGTWVFEAAKFMDERRVARNRQGRLLSRWTLDSDAAVLRGFGRWFGESNVVGLVTSVRLEDWCVQLRAEGKPGTTIKTYLMRLHAFFGWLVKRGGLVRNPVAGVKVPDPKRTRSERFLTREQRDLIIERCERDDLRLMLMLGFHAGLRLREMVEARPEWLRLWPGGGEICVCETETFIPKDGEQRRIPLNERLLAYLGGLTFSGRFLVRPDVGHAKHKYRWEPRKCFARLLKDVGLEWVGWHTLRHTFATLLVQGGCPIATVAQWLGDGIEVTFKNYVGYAPVAAHVNAGL